jgi:hypothetical protein
MSKLFASLSVAWGGGPGEVWWRGICRGFSGSEANLPITPIYPSTTLRVVPLPTSFARREAKEPPFSRRKPA